MKAQNHPFLADSQISGGFYLLAFPPKSWGGSYWGGVFVIGSFAQCRVLLGGSFRGPLASTGLRMARKSS